MFKNTYQGIVWKLLNRLKSIWYTYYANSVVSKSLNYVSSEIGLFTLHNFFFWASKYKDVSIGMSFLSVLAAVDRDGSVRLFYNFIRFFQLLKKWVRFLTKQPFSIIVSSFKIFVRLVTVIFQGRLNDFIFVFKNHRFFYFSNQSKWVVHCSFFYWTKHSFTKKDRLLLKIFVC